MTVSSETLRSISTPDSSKPGLGRSPCMRRRAERRGRVEMVYDHLDFMHALNVFLNGYAGASTCAMRKGFQEAGGGR